MDFNKLNLNENILRAITDLNYTKTTKIQQDAIPIILENKDILAIAQTGTGKTASFVLPILDKLINLNINNTDNLKVLIIAPTRELVTQIYNSIIEYSKYINLNSIYSHGGIEIEEQENIFKEKKFQILVSTPKRFLDLREKNLVGINEINFLVVDEIDLIIEQNSKNDLRKIFKILPKKKQSLFFSATINNELEEISKEFLKENYKKIQVEEEKINLELIEQKVYFVQKENKFRLLLDILKEKQIRQSLIFLNDKKDIDNLVRFLNNNSIKSSAFHSAKSNVHREKALNNFKIGKQKILIATDIASRGLDIENLTHVINFDLPLKSQDYIHRVGRVGRANIKGTALSFCSSTEKSFLEKIQKLINQKLQITTHNFHSHFAQTATGSNAKPKYKRKMNNFKKEKTNTIDYSKWLNKKK